jgi:predicted nucleic acid-binding Zn ribbon protein|tara:strand:+ start:1041 stop:1184 length:144 start_codon:yes stop_codon:yes gene_type:complete
LVSGGSGLIFKGSGFYLTDYKNGKKDPKDKKETKKKETPKKIKKEQN